MDREPWEKSFVSTINRLDYESDDFERADQGTKQYTDEQEDEN